MSSRKASLGFTLIEMAMVVTIMGLVMMTVFPALSTVRQANQIALTQSNLRSLMLATAAFVQANGCLPCPAAPGGTETDFGRMNTASAGASCGPCSAPQGIPPFVALGIPSQTAHDGWGHWITMRVDPSLTNPAAVVVPPYAPCTTADVTSGLNGCTIVGAAVKGLCKAGTAANGSAASGIRITATGNGATQLAAVVFISHGRAGYGSYDASPRRTGYLLPFDSTFAPCGSTSGFAQCNSASRNTNQFFDALTQISDVDTYDDVLTYADRNVLVSMLGGGSCNTTW